MKNVCIIEDSGTIRKLYCTILNKAGYETKGFEDATSAFNWLQENEPDLIIMDILLPDMNGTELVVKVRELPHLTDIPILAITGFSSLQDKEVFLSAGFSAYLSKPIIPNELVSQVKELIG